MKKILVIDDEEPVRANIQMLLHLEGYQSVSARNGFEGIDIAKKEIPDLIICDVMMPKCDGYKVLEELRNYQPTAIIPFIFLTGKTEWDDLRKGMGLGSDDYLKKPFKISELVETVRIQLSKHEKYVENAENDKWESEERFKAVFNYAPMGIALIDPDGKMVKVNTTYCKIIGYQAEELYKKTIMDLTFKDDLDNSIELNEKIKRGLTTK